MAKQQHTSNNTPQEPPFRTLVKYTCEWIESNVLLVLAIPAVLLFMSYYEDEYVKWVGSAVYYLGKSTWGYPLVWITFGLLFVILIYRINSRDKNMSNADSRTVYAALFASALFFFTLCVTPQDNPLPTPFKVTLWLAMILLWWLCFIQPLMYFLGNKRMNNQLEKKSEALSQEIGYIDDEPVADSEKDVLGLKPYVQELIKRIRGIRLGHTGSIAITGSWGAGKSSFVKMLEEELKSDDYKDEFIFLTFEPMRCERPELIQSAFLDQLEAALSQYRTGFARHFRLYKELIGAVDNKYLGFVTTLFSITQEEEFVRIQRAIQSLHRRIVVFIDDVDRLERDELVQIFRLVRFNAKFNNLVFLLAMDKTKVEATMGSTDNFSDKFAETEFYLPVQSPDAVWNFLVRNINVEGSEMEQSYDFENDSSLKPFVRHCLPTLRDAKRFVNSFSLRCTHMYMSERYIFRDYFLLSLLHYADREAFDILAREESFKKDDDQLNLPAKQDEFHGIRAKIDNILWNLAQELFPSKKVDVQTDKYWYGINNKDYYFSYFNEVTMVTNSVLDYAWSLLDKNTTYDQIKSHIETLDTASDFKAKLVRCFKHFPINNLPSDDPRVGKYFIVRDILGIEKFDFQEGLALVKKGGKYGFIDKAGAVKIPIEYDHAWPFSEGLARVKKGGKWGFIDQAGAVKVSIEYDHAWAFSEGLAAVEKGGKWGFVDKTGAVQIPFEYDDAWSFSNGRAEVEKDREEFYIDKEGKKVD